MSDRSFHEGRKGGRMADTTVLILALFAVVTALGAAQKAEIKTEKGVRVVRNPTTPVAGPGGAPAAVSIVEDLVIGNDTSRENYWFGFLNSLAVDDAGRIYVRTYESDGRGKVAMDVFDPAGFYIARFFVPEGEDDVTIRNDKLYSIVNDPASGNPLVKRYALKWK